MVYIYSHTVCIIMQKNESNNNLPDSWSVVTAAVRPTPDEPLPVVGIALGAVCSTYLDSEIRIVKFDLRFVSIFK